MLGLIRKIFDTNAKEVRRLQERAQAINALEPEIKALSDDDLRAKKMSSACVWITAPPWTISYLKLSL